MIKMVRAHDFSFAFDQYPPTSTMAPLESRGAGHPPHEAAFAASDALLSELVAAVVHHFVIQEAHANLYHKMRVLLPVEAPGQDRLNGTSRNATTA